MFIMSDKVLLVMDHAPDYREDFFRELGKKVDLTVVAQPCEPDSLTPPIKRYGYTYIEKPSKKLFGLIWQRDLKTILNKEKWDIICCDLNLRHLKRVLIFLSNSALWNRWIWRGQIFGRNKSWILDKIRNFLLKKSGGCLVYTDEIAENVQKKFRIKTYSFNNTQVKEKDFRKGIFDYHSGIRLLFAGRNQPRKKLERLVHLATRREDVSIKMIGPGMHNIEIPEFLKNSGKIKRYGYMIGNELNPHFDWADMVINPGHVGLLALNAAKHGKGIVIDSKSQHAPEYIIAKEAKQPFIAFDDDKEVDQFIDDIIKNRWKLKKWGNNLQAIAKEKYTVEHMAKVHLDVFKKYTKEIINK